MGALISKEMFEYFGSQEGAGAFRLALGKFMLVRTQCFENAMSAR
jgi:hypothetical protein